MIRIIKYYKNNVIIKYCIQKNPTPGTFGDYILLKKRLASQGEGWLLEKIKEKDPKRYNQMTFNMKFLKKMRKKHKKLHCVYCGKKHLKIYEFHEKVVSSNMATADHFLPKSLCPDLEFEESNLRISCSSCNTRKGSLIWEENFKYKNIK